MLTQSLFYTILVSLPLLSNTLPLPNSHQENHIIRAVRDLSHQQKLAVRAIASPTTTTPESTPIIWTSVEPTTPPATLLFYSAATGITTTPTLPLYTPNTRSTTTIPAQEVVYPTLPPTVQEATTPLVVEQTTSTTSIIADVQKPPPSPQPQLQLITYNYVPPSKPTTTATIVFAAPTLLPSPTFVAIGTSTYSIASTIINFGPNFPNVTPTPLVQKASPEVVFVPTTTYGLTTIYAIAPQSAFAPVPVPSPQVVNNLPQTKATTTTTTTTSSSNSDNFIGSSSNDALAALVAAGTTHLPIGSANSSTTSNANTGALTYYIPSTNITACNLTSTSTNSVVLSSAIFNSYPGATSNPNLNPICGQSIKIIYGSQVFNGIVSDSCENCGEFDVGISQSVWNGLGSDSGSTVQWSFV